MKLITNMSIRFIAYLRKMSLLEFSFYIFLLSLSLVAVSATTSEAQVMTVSGAGDSIVDNMARQFDGMGARLSNAVVGIAVMLFAVDIVFTFGRAIISGAGFGDVTSRFVMRLGFVIVVLGFARTIDDIVPALITAALNIGRIASGGEAAIDPSVGGIMMDGVHYGAEAMKQISIWEPLSIFYILVGVLMVVVAAIIAAVLALVYAEFYVVAFAGMIVLGFAGLTGTKETAVLYMKSVLGQALKLVGFLITYSVMQEVTLSVLGSRSFSLGLENLLMAVGLQIILVVLIATIPSAMMALAGGITAGGASEMAAKVGSQATATAVGAGAGAAIGAGIGAAAGAGSALAGSTGGPLMQQAGSMLAGAGSGAGAGARKGANMALKTMAETSRPGIGRHAAKVMEKMTREKGNE